MNISFGSKYMIIRQTHLNHQFLLSHLGFPQLDNGWFMLVLYPDECIRSDCWHLQSYSLVHYTKEILEQPSFKSNSSPISRSSKTLQLLVVHFLRIGHKTERNSCRMFLSNPQHQFQVHTNASVKSYQLVKVVSGGRAPGKSSILASPQLLVIERFLRFGAVRLGKSSFFFNCVDFF